MTEYHGFDYRRFNVLDAIDKRLEAFNEVRKYKIACDKVDAYKHNPCRYTDDLDKLRGFANSFSKCSKERNDYQNRYPNRREDPGHKFHRLRVQHFSNECEEKIRESLNPYEDYIEPYLNAAAQKRKGISKKSRKKTFKKSRKKTSKKSRKKTSKKSRKTIIKSSTES